MTIDTVWQHPSQLPVLKDDQVHIWRANLDLPYVEIVRLTALLAPDEVTRANKFRFPHLKARFIAARGILRQLLGNYLSINPDQIQFEYSDRGKPQLSNSNPDHTLQFNISHSQANALYGFTYHHQIGVDLEYIREMSDALKIAQRFFSPREYKLLKESPIEEQQLLFFKLWTAKEAYLKAVGTGLAGSLSEVEIKLNSDLSPQLQAIQGSPETIANWSLYPCPTAIDYVGAIAISPPKLPQQINFWHWHQDLAPVSI